MKKYKAIFKINGELQELTIFATKSDEVKVLDGFVTITENTRVKHPSPEILIRTLYSMGIEAKTFYETADKITEQIQQPSES